jgi:hypothetical protein
MNLAEGECVVEPIFIVVSTVLASITVLLPYEFIVEVTMLICSASNFLFFYSFLWMRKKLPEMVSGRERSKLGIGAGVWRKCSATVVNSTI